MAFSSTYQETRSIKRTSRIAVYYFTAAMILAFLACRIGNPFFKGAEMLAELLSLFDEERAYFQRELAAILGVTHESMMAWITYLEHLGMIRRIENVNCCNGNCNQRESVGVNYHSSIVMLTEWELVRKET